MSKTIYDYPTKEILVADLIKLCGNKNHYRIVEDNTFEVLHDDRAEYLEWTSEGYADPLCDRVVDSMEVLGDGILEVYVKEIGKGISPSDITYGIYYVNVDKEILRSARGVYVSYMVKDFSIARSLGIHDNGSIEIINIDGKDCVTPYMKHDVSYPLETFIKEQYLGGIH